MELQRAENSNDPEADLTPCAISGFPLLNALRVVREYTALAVILASGMPTTSAQIQPVFDFADMIRTPAGIQKTLEYCDGHPEFETALANWLETAEPSSPADRQAVRETSLRLLEDTADRQLVLGLSDGLLRHYLEDVKRDPAIVPKELAHALFANISKAVRKQRSKVIAITAPAYGLAEDGTVADERQASFLEEFLNLAEPRVAHIVRPSQRWLGDSARNSREQADGGPSSGRYPLQLRGLEPNLRSAGR